MQSRFSLINALKNTAKSVVNSFSRVNKPLSGSELHAMYGLLINSGEQSEYSTHADFESKIKINVGVGAMASTAPIYIFNEHNITSLLLPPAGITNASERLDGALFDLNKILESSLPLLGVYKASKIIVPIAEASSAASFVGVNGHWVTLLIDIDENKIQIIDSKSNLINKSELDTNLLKTIQPVLEKNKIKINAIKRIHTGHQAATDLNSCGYLTLQYVKDLLANNIKNLTTISDQQIQTAESFLEATKKSAAEFGKKNAYQDFYSYIKESGITVPLKQKQALSNQANTINIIDNYFSAKDANSSPSLTGESTDTASPGQSNEDNQSEITQIESDDEIIEQIDKNETDNESINSNNLQPDLVKSDEHAQIDTQQVPSEPMPIFMPKENLGANEDTQINIDTSPDTQKNQLHLNQSSTALDANDTDSSIKMDIPNADELPVNQTSLISENDTANDIKIDISTLKNSDLDADAKQSTILDSTSALKDEISHLVNDSTLIATPTLYPDPNDSKTENDVQIGANSQMDSDDEDDPQTNPSNKPVGEKQQGLLARLWSNVKYYVVKAWNFVTGLFSQTKPLDTASPTNNINNPVDNASIDGDQPDANNKPKLTRKGRLLFQDIGTKNNTDQTKPSDPSSSPKLKQ